MTLIALLLVTAAAVFLTLKGWTPRYGVDVEARFLERLNYIPSQQPALLSRKILSAWLCDTALAGERARYAFPILFPLDLIFLLSLGGLLGCISAFVGHSLILLSGIPAWIWWVLPTIFVFAGLSEDALIIALIKNAVVLTDSFFDILRTVTKIKLALVNAAIAHTAALLGIAGLVRVFPNPAEKS